MRLYVVILNVPVACPGMTIFATSNFQELSFRISYKMATYESAKVFPVASWYGPGFGAINRSKLFGTIPKIRRILFIWIAVPELRRMCRRSDTYINCFAICYVGYSVGFVNLRYQRIGYLRWPKDRCRCSHRKGRWYRVFYVVGPSSVNKKKLINVPSWNYA